MKRKFREIRRTYGALLAFVVLAGAGGVALDRTQTNNVNTLHGSLLKGCVRGNVLRVELNKRLAANNAEKDAVVTFLTDAERAREASYKLSRQPSDLRASQEYRELANDITSKVVYVRFPTVNCAKAYPKP